MTESEGIGVIGGTGLYDLPGGEVENKHLVDTPFGSPSGEITEVKVGEQAVFFLPRHGASHGLLPHEINYRANIFALKSLGVTSCLSVCASGSLKEEFKPGDFVMVDQVIDFTVRRNISFFGDGLAAYPSLADPLDGKLGESLSPVLEKNITGSLHNKGTYVAIEGPHLSTRAESLMFRSWGADLIGMTACPEVQLAAEAQLSFVIIAMITDYDCWKEGEEDVSAAGVIEVAKRTTGEVHSALPEIIGVMKEKGRSQSSATRLQGALMGDPAELPHQDVLNVLLK